MSSRDAIARSDRRWLLTIAAVFTVTIGGLFGAREVYRATGPHPTLSTLIRRTKSYANTLLRKGRITRRYR